MNYGAQNTFYLLQTCRFHSTVTGENTAEVYCNKLSGRLYAVLFVVSSLYKCKNRQIKALIFVSFFLCILLIKI